ncbi:MAG: hypothetical protein P9M13_00735 [Candidatus Ancaeobacter aquaticus]|nr:hypothetical protein [Candidatus Ancaeobacter aquaticus]
MNANLSFDIKLIEKLSCPYHLGSDLTFDREHLVCVICNRKFPIFSRIPYILPDDMLDKYKNGNFQEFVNSWKPGERTWNPVGCTKLMTTSKSVDNQTKKYSLDIGCGENAQGEVNIDVYVPKIIPNNFIVASAEYLPFKDNVFPSVKSSYVIEHTLEPAQFINNQARIATEEILIVTDNSEWIGDVYFRMINMGRIFHDEHFYRWTVEYLGNLIRRLGLKVDVYCANCSPTKIVRLFSQLGKIPRIGNFFYRDLIAKIELQ